MAKLIFDIETIGADYDSLDEMTKKQLTYWAEKEAEDEEDLTAKITDIKERLSFSPLTGQIVVIGVMDQEKEKGVIYYQSPDSDLKEITENNFTFKPCTEKEMLENFWQGAKNYSQFVSFNGRGFDAPYLIIRSAINKIKPSVNLMAYRYIESQKMGPIHIDLFDQLSFYGAVRRKSSLHLYCQAFGIKSPKTEGVTGDNLGELFKAKEYLRIAKYNLGDLIATAELYDYWEKYVKV